MQLFTCKARQTPSRTYLLPIHNIYISDHGCLNYKCSARVSSTTIQEEKDRSGSQTLCRHNKCIRLLAMPLLAFIEQISYPLIGSN